MSIASIVDALVEAGATPQMIAAAVRAHAEKQDVEQEDRRAYERERKRKYRMSRVSPDVPGTPRDNPGQTPKEEQKQRAITTIVPGVQNTPSLSKDEIKDKRKGRGVGKRTALDPDFAPEPDLIAFAEMQGLSDAQWRRETEKFKNYYLGSGKLMAEWPKAWRNWMLRAAEYLKCTPISSTTAPRPEGVPHFETPEEFDAWWAKRSTNRGAA